MSVKQVQAKVERLTERIVKAQTQLDAWKMERKELRLQLADLRGAANKPKRDGRVRTKLRTAR
jgi:hypothetical protein